MIGKMFFACGSQGQLAAKLDQDRPLTLSKKSREFRGCVLFGRIASVILRIYMLCSPGQYHLRR